MLLLNQGHSSPANGGISITTDIDLSGGLGLRSEKKKNVLCPAHGICLAWSFWASARVYSQFLMTCQFVQKSQQCGNFACYNNTVNRTDANQKGLTGKHVEICILLADISKQCTQSSIVAPSRPPASRKESSSTNVRKTRFGNV